MTVDAKILAMLEGSSIVKTDSMESAGDGMPRISLSGKKFAIDGNKVGDTLAVVILDVYPRTGFSKTYYESGYKPGGSDAPDCTSSDGVYPDAYIDNPVNDNCARCPQSQWGSATSMSGKKAKACKDSKRLYVVRAEELDNAEPTVYIVIVTVLSLKPLTVYSRQLQKDGIASPAIVITELGFDDDQSVPVLSFNNLGVMKPEQCKLAIAQGTEVTKTHNPTKHRALSAPIPEISAKPELPSTTTEYADAGHANAKSIDEALDNW